MLQLWLSFAQKHDNLWLAGYYDNVNEPGYGNASFDFQSNTAGQIGMDSYGANFESTLATMCDSSGALLSILTAVLYSVETKYLTQRRRTKSRRYSKSHLPPIRLHCTQRRDGIALSGASQ